MSECIEPMEFSKKVNETMFILMKTGIFICRGRHEGKENLETYRDIQGETRTDRDRKGQTGIDRQAGKRIDRQGQVGTSRNTKGLSLFFLACPCLVPACRYFVPACPCWSLIVPACLCLFLLVPALSLALTGIIGK